MPDVGVNGLTGTEAHQRLAEFGPNAVAEDRRHPWRDLLAKLWGPVPWMLEAVMVLQLILGNSQKAAIIAVLPATNALLGFVQESRANQALALLERRLGGNTRARLCPTAMSLPAFCPRTSSASCSCTKKPATWSPCPVTA